MGFLVQFVRMVRMLFYNAHASVSLNNEIIESFVIERGMRQGCPLIPYLFLIVAEALHSATRAAAARGQLSGITLPDGATQQLMLQNANDTSYTLAGLQPNLDHLSTLLS
jgi:hypothetical protein